MTQYVQWRWCLFINVPIAAGAFLVGRRVVPPMPVQRNSKPDVPGAVLVTSSLVALVYGLSEAATKGWSSPATLTALFAGIGLLVSFVAVESRLRAPMLPLRIPMERNRGGAYIAVGLAVIAMYGLFLLLTYDFQVVLGYSPARAGAAFLPMSVAVMVSSTTISRVLLPKVPPRLLMVPGLLIGAVGMAALTGLRPHADYVSVVLPAEVLLGLGMGAVFVPAFSTATAGVDHSEAGVASAVANTAQQMGASLGTALLNTVAAGATTGYLAGHPHMLAAGLVHGYSTAAGLAAILLVIAAGLVGTLVTLGRPAHEGTEPLEGDAAGEITSPSSETPSPALSGS